MDVVRIKGGIPLKGAVTVGGAKNAALPIFAATLLTEEPCLIENVPDLSDVRFMAGILSHLGAEVEEVSPHTWRIAARNVSPRAPYELVRQMRASVCLLGPLVGRLRRADVSLPGGCVIGPRPIDLHLKGLAKLGCGVEVVNGYIRVDGRHLAGGNVFLGGRHGSTVTGTANLLMAAVMAPGASSIESAACEPEIVDLCRMLQAMGADIEGIGSHHLEVRGVKRLRGCAYRILPDRIEAGTYLLAGAVTGGELTVHGADPAHLRAFFDKLEESGLDVATGGSGELRVSPREKPRRPAEIITLPYPGFPTDLQAQMGALMALTPGLSIITERIYPNRFMHVPELLRMGARIAIEGASAIIEGVPRLSGAPVMASDLRASAALILAALAAEGESWIQRIYHIDRGYEHIDAKLRQAGADIIRVNAEEMPKDLQGDWL